MIDEIPGKKKTDTKKKSKTAPSGAGRRSKKPTHVRYRSRKYAQFVRGEWTKLGRKLTKIAKKGGLHP